ncbi:MAG: alpha/beta hydrolase [archaeon]|nr:alpha/beta hydrolase [archaeon]
MKEPEKAPVEENMSFSYDTLWKAIIRPPREKYEIGDLGEPNFTYHKIAYERTDYSLVNKRGYTLQCSFLQPPVNIRKDYIMPVVVYLHGNSSCRLEGLKSCQELLKSNINIFTFDFSGCGLSEGDYITLGWNEKDDVSVVVDFLEKLPGVGNIGLWGRSMGAATTMMYTSSDPRIKAICMDSPFGDFNKLAHDLCGSFIKLPDFLFNSTFSIVKGTVKDKCGLDLNKLQPALFANKTSTPAFFIHAMNDELIKVDQTLKMYESYKGPKTLNIVEGGHNSVRQKHIYEKVAKFFDKYLSESEEEK